MTGLLIQTEPTPLRIDLSSLLPQVRMTDSQFYQFCVQNSHLRIERSADGQKMQEYMDNGAQLGLLIDRQNYRVYVYRSQEAVEVLEHPEQVRCDRQFAGLILQMARIC